MQEIKEYKPQTIVYYKDIDGSINTLITDKSNKNSLIDQMNKSKFIMLEGILINVYNIQKIEDTKGSLEELYYSQPREFRNKLDIKAKKMGSLNGLAYISDISQGREINMKDRLFSMIDSYNNPQE